MTDRMIQNIRDALKKYVEDNGLKSLVLGVSGGIDSCLVAALARPVCDELNIPLIGRSITIESNKQDEIERARLVGNAFCTDFKEVDLTTFYRAGRFDLCDVETYPWENFNDLETKIRLGNVKARIRMIRLYDIAQATHGMVLGTTNAVEYLTGYLTLGGDGCVDYEPIIILWKGQVYEMSVYLASQYANGKSYDAKAGAIIQCIVATPTDGNGISSSDIEQLGVDSYDEADKILKIWLTEDEDAFAWDACLKYPDRPETWEEFEICRDSFKDHPIVLRHERTHFKRNHPININHHTLYEGVDVDTLFN